ncbi:MAG: VCBS repeat-containing protein [bacterium]
MDGLGLPAPSIAESSNPAVVHFNLLRPFHAPVSSDPGRQAFALADVNGDRVLDLVVADQLHFTMDVYLGNGDGTFTFVHDYYADVDPKAVAVTDLTSPPASGLGGAPDGIPDVVVGAERTVWIFAGHGDGSFEKSHDLTDVAGVQNPIGFFLGDFNGDGRTDIAIGENYVGRGVVFLCYANGSFAQCDPHSDYTATAQGVIRIAGGDFNGDGALDVAALSYAGDLSILLGNGAGGFAAQPAFSVRSEGTYPLDFVSTYGLAHGGKDDLIVANLGTFPFGSGNRFGVTVSGRPDGGFCTNSFVMEPETNGVALADFTGDEIPDLIATTRELCPYPPLTVSLGAGAGVCSTGNSGFSDDFFQPGGTGSRPDCPTLDSDASVIAAADLGGDALPDFLVLQLDGTMRVGINDTQTPFVPTVRPELTCVGDCRQPGVVDVSDLITGVDIMFGRLPGSACPSLADRRCRVDIARMIEAVNAALNGCVPGVPDCR